MKRKILNLAHILLLTCIVISGITAVAFHGNRHWENTQDAYERYEKSQIEKSRNEKVLPDQEREDTPNNTTDDIQDSESVGYRITPFRVVAQYPELPTGCEITALTMVLNYYGYAVDKMDMALTYLPQTEAEFYENEKGLLIGPDMEKYFVGDPTGDGYICGNTAIETAANRYLISTGSECTAKALDGVSPTVLYQYIEEDMPVVVWVTINMEDREETDGWYLEDGTYMEWSGNDHGAVLIGYSENTVTIADPIYDIVICPRERFEQIFEERGSQCVVLEKDTEQLA